MELRELSGGIESSSSMGVAVGREICAWMQYGRVGWPQGKRKGVYACVRNFATCQPVTTYRALFDLRLEGPKASRHRRYFCSR